MKFWRQCVNVTEPTWGHIYFLTCKNFSWEFRTQCAMTLSATFCACCVNMMLTNYAQMSFNEEWNVFSAFNPSKCTHLEQRAADCAAPGEQLWTSCRSRDSNPQPWVTSGFKSNALSIRPTTDANCSSRRNMNIYSSHLHKNRFSIPQNE